MKLYEDHKLKWTYYIGEEDHLDPPKQNEMFEKVIKVLENNLPEHLSLRINEPDFEYKSVNVTDKENRTYIHMRCYKRSGFPRKWRIKLMTQEDRGEKFLKEFFIPLLESVSDD